MIEIQRILCPVDFSDTSRRALEHAVAIAVWYESQIVALHVVHTPVLPQPPVLFAELTSGGPPAAVHRSREAELRSFLEPARRAGVKSEVVVDEGHPADRIVDRARAERADLIVMGTHGLSGLERLMLGSVAEKVLRRATCPVMTVPLTAVTSATVPYTRLLCPLDFSESSLAAVRFAFSLAEEADARLTLLHVVEWPADDELLVEQFDTPELRRTVEERATRRLEALVTDDVKTWCRPAAKIGYGKPYRQILETARNEASDLIVIGIRGRNPLDLVLFGSTTNHVVRRASCPVLTLRP